MIAAVTLAILTGLSQAPAPSGANHPFGVGEKLTFDVRFGPLKVGTSTMEVREISHIRGRAAYKTYFRVQGGTFFYKVDDVLQSWIDTETLSSLRFVQSLEEGSRQRERHFEIYPDRSVFVEVTKSPAELPPSRDLSTTRRFSTSSGRFRWRWDRRTSSTGTSGRTAIP